MDIFLKKDKIITFDEIKNIIPQCSINKSQPQADKTEWRWRFIKLNEQVVLEISRQRPNEQRFFWKNGQWVLREIDKIFDKYVVNQYYCYTNIDE